MKLLLPLMALPLMASTIHVSAERQGISLEGVETQAAALGDATLDMQWNAQLLTLGEVPAYQQDAYRALATAFLAQHPEATLGDLRFLVPAENRMVHTFRAPLEIIVAPEPSTWGLVLLGGLWWLLRERRTLLRTV